MNMTNEQTVIAAFSKRFGVTIEHDDAVQLLKLVDGNVGDVLDVVRNVPEKQLPKLYNPVGWVITVLKGDEESKSDNPKRKPKVQEPDETVVEEYNRMVEADIITVDEKFALLNKSASREVKFAVAKQQYPYHSRLWGRAAGLDVNQMVIFCELDPVQQENPDWGYIEQEAQRRTDEWHREWIDTGKINKVSVAGTIKNIAQKWDATDKVPF